MTLVAAPATATRRSAPVGPSERIRALDIIRGFALFGMIALDVPSSGYGAHLTLRPYAYLLAAILLFAVVALASRAWLTRFSFGPLERLWRTATYAGLQP